MGKGLFPFRTRPCGLRGKWRHAALRDLAREPHYLRPAPAERRPAMAPFGAATRLATKREQTLEESLRVGVSSRSSGSLLAIQGDLRAQRVEMIMVALDAFLQPGRMFFEQRLARRQRGIAAFAQFGIADDVVQRHSGVFQAQDEADPLQVAWAIDAKAAGIPSNLPQQADLP